MRSGILTGFAQLVLAASAAAVAALLAQKFGRNARTDGFLAAYQVYVLLTVAAQSFRLAVTPALTRAAAAGQLGAELRGFGVAFGSVAVPVAVLVALFAAPLGRAVTGTLPHAAASEAAAALVWVVPAAFAQLFAGLCASALAALDSYGTAALGYGAGGIVGVAVFAVFANAHGIVSLAWGVAANATVALAVPLAGLVRRRALGAAGPIVVDARRRLWALVQGATLPVMLQVFAFVAIRLLADVGVGRVTSFSYAYLIAATLVSITVLALSLVSSTPLTRRGFDADDSAEHVVHASWLSLALAGAATGVIVLVGGRMLGLVLGSEYRSVGRLYLWLTPWLVAATACYAVFPLVFVAEHRSRLVGLALAGLALDVPLAYGMRREWGVHGVALSLGIATAAVAVAMMAELSGRLLRRVTGGYAQLVLVVAAITGASFGLPALVLGAPAAAAVGVVVYVLLLLLLRGRGLRDAWAYTRGLH